MAFGDDGGQPTSNTSLPPQILSKRFTEIQVERAVRVIKQLSAYPEEQCLAELADVFENSDFPRTDDKLYGVLSDRLWEGQQQNRPAERTPRSTAARVNALANSLRGHPPSSVFLCSDDDSEDEIRPVVKNPTTNGLPNSLHGQPSSSVYLRDDSDSEDEIRPALKRSRQTPTDSANIILDSPPLRRTFLGLANPAPAPQKSKVPNGTPSQQVPEVITIDDSDDDSIICLMTPEPPKVSASCTTNTNRNGIVPRNQPSSSSAPVLNMFQGSMDLSAKMDELSCHIVSTTDQLITNSNWGKRDSSLLPLGTFQESVDMSVQEGAVKYTVDSTGDRNLANKVRYGTKNNASKSNRNANNRIDDVQCAINRSDIKDRSKPYLDTFQESVDLSVQVKNGALPIVSDRDPRIIDSNGNDTIEVANKADGSSDVNVSNAQCDANLSTKIDGKETDACDVLGDIGQDGAISQL